MIGAAAVAVGAGALVRHRAPSLPVTVGVMGLILAPVPSVASAFLWWSLSRFRRARSAARSQRSRRSSVLEAGELIGLGLAGGLSVAAAHRMAALHAAEDVAADLEDLVDRMERRGVAPALASDRGPVSQISRVLATATAAGAPVLQALEAHLEQEHHRIHTSAVEVARRLPIRLLIPLTLLVLPGFVLITVGPAVMDSLARLSP